MKNPMKVTLQNGQEWSIGDPFILRFNGMYYLYPSSHFDEGGIHLFVSKDLLHFEDKGLVAHDKLLTCAYAPEVIYHDGYFYMCTSPSGQGHYILKSKSPEGPFEIITDNLGSMIDGSFILDKDFSIRMSRAAITGIAMMRFDGKRLYGRKDILPAIASCWSEGPVILYRDGGYYAMNCGNHLQSTAYRCYSAYSEFIDHGYSVQDYPTIISTKDRFNSLGHSNIFLAPNHDTYYVGYHSLKMLNDTIHFRWMNYDPIQFNGRIMAINPSNIELKDFSRPLFETYNPSEELKRVGDRLLIGKSGESFNAEFNISGSTSIYAGTMVIKTNRHNINVEINGETILDKDLPIDFINFHSLRLISSDHLELLLDNVPLLSLPYGLGESELAYGYKEDGLFYTAFNNLAFQESMPNPIFLPGKIESSVFAKGKISDEGDRYIGEGNYSHQIVKEKKGPLKVFLNLSSDDEGSIIIKSKSSSISVDIKPSKDQYEFINVEAGDLELDSQDEIKIEIKGKIKLRRLFFKELVHTNKTLKDFVRKDDEDQIILLNPKKEISVKFAYESFEENAKWGILLNAHDLSFHIHNCRPKFMGYYVGFWNRLLVCEHIQYGAKRIHDKPTSIETKQIHDLKIINHGHNVDVYLDGEWIFESPLKYEDVYGYSGLYISKECKVKIIEYKEKEEEE